MGLIPAHAGSTHGSATPMVHSRAHPRSRGEHTATVTLRPVAGGSSPLTRGAPRRIEYALHVLGLIPAHAGSTDLVHKPAGKPTAHPRSRGEHSFANPKLVAPHGSSPLTRGALVGHFEARCPQRLIPAHAGSTLPRLECSAAHRAHPRSRGEHFGFLGEAPADCGSSPLTRGAPERVMSARAAVGLIPAHAGSTAPTSKPA